MVKNHAKNQKHFREACEAGDFPLVVDNTNMQRWEMEPYIQAAEENGYKVIEVIIEEPSNPKHQEECAARNTHGVSLEIIQKMAARFER